MLYQPSPNHALQRTAPGVTACAPARRPAPAAFPHRLRRPPQSLSLGSLGDLAMRTICATSLVLALMAHVTLALDITTADGQTYKQCEVNGIEPDALRITHADGATRIPYDKLPPAIQKQYFDREGTAEIAKHAYDIVKTAEQFTVGGVGFAGRPSRQEMAFRQLLKQPEPVSRCKKLLTEATPAGQLYALLGLRLLDQPAFQTALPRYKDSKTEIPTMSGCIVMRTTAAKVAKEIEKGELK